MAEDSTKKLDVLLMVFLAVALGGLAMLFVKSRSRAAAVAPVSTVQSEAQDATAPPSPPPPPVAAPHPPPVQAVAPPPPPSPPKVVPPPDEMMAARPPQLAPPPHLHRAAPARGLASGGGASPSPPPPPAPPAMQVPALAAAVPPLPPTPPAEDDATKLDDALANLKPGNLAYSTPTQMKLGETQQVVAKIATADVSAAALAAGLPADAGAQVATATTSITPKMKMTLTSADFDITALSSEEQLVAGSVPTTWEWGIVPKHSGELQLHLAATIELNGLQKDFTTVDREIAVKVDPADEVGDFVKANWQWIIATLTGIVGAVMRYWSGRKKKAEIAA